MSYHLEELPQSTLVFNIDHNHLYVVNESDMFAACCKTVDGTLSLNAQYIMPAFNDAPWVSFHMNLENNIAKTKYGVDALLFSIEVSENTSETSRECQIKLQNDYTRVYSDVYIHIIQSGKPNIYRYFSANIGTNNNVFVVCGSSENTTGNTAYTVFANKQYNVSKLFNYSYLGTTKPCFCGDITGIKGIYDTVTFKSLSNPSGICNMTDVRICMAWKSTGYFMADGDYNIFSNTTVMYNNTVVPADELYFPANALITIGISSDSTVSSVVSYITASNESLYNNIKGSFPVIVPGYINGDTILFGNAIINNNITYENASDNMENPTKLN